MEFANINDTMRTAKDEEKRFIPLFGSETFRSWILYFRPGEHTDMHFHMSPETFLVLEGKASVRGLKGEERIIEKNEIVFFGAKDYYQITNVGTEPLVLVGNRSEAFGGAHVASEGDDAGNTLFRADLRRDSQSGIGVCPRGGE